MSAGAKRVFGLDAMRALAISCVVAGHFLQQSLPPHWLARFGSWGILGVEIFFVLSGFLIGGILIDLLEAGRLQTPKDLLSFWNRRWLRTLPLYYLFLFIFLRYDWTGATRLGDHLRHLVFLQSFAWKGPVFFTLAWSLAIEEYFYLLFPLALWALQSRGLRPRRALALTILGFVVVPLAVKLWWAPFHVWDDFDWKLRMVTVTRLDSIGYGVAAVFLKRYRPHLWARIRRGKAWAAAGLLGVCLYLYLDVPGLLASYALQVLFFPVISLTVAACLPIFDDWRAPVRRGWQRGVVRLSETSYSIYLGHILVLTLVNNVVLAAPGGRALVYNHPLRIYPAYLFFLFLLTPTTYFLWERPWLDLRDGRASRLIRILRGCFRISRLLAVVARRCHRLTMAPPHA